MRTRNSFFVLGIFSMAFVLFSIGSLSAQESPSPKTDTAATGSAMKSDTEIDGITAEVVSVARTDGDTITVKFKFSNGSQKKTNVYLTGYSPDNLAEKVYYIDAKNKKKYTVIKDAGGDSVCSKTQSVELEPGESKSGWSKLPAPPAGVTTITLFLPGTPPFEGVPLAP